MMHVVFMKAGEMFPETKECEDIDQVFGLLNIKKNTKGVWTSHETYLLNEGDEKFKGLGVIVRDQDRVKKPNILGLKGNFIIIGLERIENTPGMTMFQGLRKDQISLVRQQIARQLVRGGMANMLRGASIIK